MSAGGEQSPYKFWPGEGRARSQSLASLGCCFVEGRRGIRRIPPPTWLVCVGAAVLLGALKHKTVANVKMDWSQGPWKGGPPSDDVIRLHGMGDTVLFEPLHHQMALYRSCFDEFGHFIKDAKTVKGVGEFAEQLSDVSSRMARVLASWSRNSCDGQHPAVSTLNGAPASILPWPVLTLVVVGRS